MAPIRGKGPVSTSAPSAGDRAESAACFIVGTRPEAIKQIPVFLALKEAVGSDRVSLVGSGQHADLLSQAVDALACELDENFEVLVPGAELTMLSAGLLTGFDRSFSTRRPSVVVVQGDTSTAAMAAWAAFQMGIPVAHNEAGLRSGSLEHPFPEEANRRLISMVAATHFAPTQLARRNLIDEGVEPSAIHVTGNTGIDAFLSAIAKPASLRAEEILSRCRQSGKRLVLMTAHRRENAGKPMSDWFSAVARFLDNKTDLLLVLPSHPNEHSRSASEAYLEDHPNVLLVPALGYQEMATLVSRSSFVITDSGGVTEEAATLGLPIVITRERTERQEALSAGLARLVGSDPGRLLAALDWAYSASSEVNEDLGPMTYLFGDGLASPRIAKKLHDLYLR